MCDAMAARLALLGLARLRARRVLVGHCFLGLPRALRYKSGANGTLPQTRCWRAATERSEAGALLRGNEDAALTIE